ncbi:MAG: agmatinase family protein [Bacteroidota bacterium]
MENKQDLIEGFDPNAATVRGKLFGLPFTPETAELVIIPVPWEVTVSYTSGTSLGPEAVLNASSQIDLFLSDIPGAWKLGIAMLPVSDSLKEENQTYRVKAEKYIRWLEGEDKGTLEEEDFHQIKEEVNQVGSRLNNYVKSQALKYLNEGKMVAVLGGDHSTPLGLINALGTHHEEFGILQIDAHMDLRNAYEGFEYSHASIMYNALDSKSVAKLVQVGIRDFCEEENDLVRSSNGRIKSYLDQDIRFRLFNGDSWQLICQDIITQLPQKVYISFDIDGLDPSLCPNTGTPVPGGLSFQEALFLIDSIVRSGREIIGFDLCEVSPAFDDVSITPRPIHSSEWDANVGCRILYQLSNLMAVSQGKLAYKAN